MLLTCMALKSLYGMFKCAVGGMEQRAGMVTVQALLSREVIPRVTGNRVNSNQFWSCKAGSAKLKNKSSAPIPAGL